jgi:hypothetical protein
VVDVKEEEIVENGGIQRARQEKNLAGEGKSQSPVTL